MAGKSFDYSKWDNIELSDDESDLHPNIDKDSWFRLKHRTRLEREQREDQEILEYEQKNKEDQARINIIQSRLKKVNQLISSSSSSSITTAAASRESHQEDIDDAAFEDTEALQIELDELQKQVQKRKKRIEEIQHKRQWNIDNICKVTEEKTIVNTVQSKALKDLAAENVEDPANATTSSSSSLPPESEVTSSSSIVTSSGGPKPPNASTNAPTAVAPPAAPAAVPPVSKGIEPAATIQRERMSIINYNDFALKNEKILEYFSEIEDLEKSKDYLFKNCDILLHEHAQSYLLLSCLEDELNGKHKRMKLVCRQSQILTHIHELGVSMKRDPRDVILPFFKRIEEEQFIKAFLQEVDNFIVKIQKRAVEKRKEMELEKQQRKKQSAKGGAAESDEEEEEDDLEYETVEGAALGPGGLNPLEVLKSLPKAMRKAFESQDVSKLQAVLASMNPQEAKHWMKQCVDSGLWVASDPTVFTNEES